ncbi:type VII secretion protein EccB [Micromonospora sp. NPDC049559]|uniref:type VII secretion protein EccB n=1 Tax=Micromonospora sp. NPDC049559 TaxID=3155923 RepID=UPI00343986F0
MPSRQDQLHSYQFMVQRVVAALVMRETDPAQSPFRRAAGATLASVLIAAIALGATVVYGVIVGGGGKGWRDPHAVIVEKESGARYVYLDEKLHLVLNYASALLIVKSETPKTVLVSRKSIEGVPRGTPLGIADAPDSLPAAARLTDAPWTICSMLMPDGTRQAPRSALLVGAGVSGGAPLGDNGVLAKHPDGSLHLIWHNRRHLIRDPGNVLSALTWTSERPVPMAPALLNALPVGADLAPIEIADRGENSVRVPDAKIGEVFVVASQGGGRQYAVAKRDGLAGITEVQANLLLTESDQREPTTLSQGRFASIPKLPDLLNTDAAAPPATTPKLVQADGGAVCGQVKDDGGVTEVRTGAAVPQVADVARTGARSVQGGALADHIVVQAGRGALVEAAAAPGATGGAISVVTDLGRRHAVSNTEVLGWLGYRGVKPVRMPANLVALIPVGRALDPEAARAPASQE